MILSSVFGYFKQLGHRLFLAYAHFRWRRWRRPWRYYGGRWYVVVPDHEMKNEKVYVITWCCPETKEIESVCIPVPGHDYSDYVPFEDRMPYSQYFPLILGMPPPEAEPEASPQRSDLSSDGESEKG